MSEQNPILEAAAFEQRLAALLGDYARSADEPFDSFAIAGAASAAAPRFRPWSRPVRLFGPGLRSAWVLLAILGLLAALVGGALVLGAPPPPPPAPGFAPDELLLADDRRQIVAVSISTGQRRVVTEGWLMAVSPDRTRLLRVTHDGTSERFSESAGSLVVTDARGRDLAQPPQGADVGIPYLATWSPNGRYVAFAHQPTAPNPLGHYAVWDTSTGIVTQLGIRAFPNGGNFPSWAPDSQHLLLTTIEGLVVADLDGDVLRTIPGTGPSSYGYWSPAGAHILHENYDHNWELLAVGPDFTTEVVSRFEPYFGSPSWSPDGRMLAGVSDDGVTVVSLENPSQPRVVYPRERLPQATLGSEWTVDAQDVKWSPDGRQLAFVAWDPIAEELAVYGADATGGEATLLMRVGDWAPRFGIYGPEYDICSCLMMDWWREAQGE